MVTDWGLAAYLFLPRDLLPRDSLRVLDVDVIPLHLLQQSGFHEELRVETGTGEETF